jgi:hypothetical protein
MAKKLKLKFDANQPHQITAIDSVVKLFEGLPTSDRSDFTLSDEIIPNLPPDETIYEDFLLENLQAVQNQNNLLESSRLEVDDGMVLEGAASQSKWRQAQVKPMFISGLSLNCESTTALVSSLSLSPVSPFTKVLKMLITAPIATFDLCMAMKLLT